MATSTAVIRSLSPRPYRVHLHVDGTTRPSSRGGTLEREDPADARDVVTVTDEGTVEEMREAIAAARRVFDGDPAVWVDDPARRRRVLLGAAARIRANAVPLAEMVSFEVGMPMRQAHPHVAAAADVFEFYAGYVGKAYGETMQLPSGSLVSLLREPVGVVGMIVPWNFPLTQAARKLAPALAVGCTAVVKPSPYTCASTFELVRYLTESGAPAGVVNFVPGAAPEIGGELAAHPDVDKLSFTGSTRVGVIVQQAAAESMKRVSLELGGKNPFLLFSDADLEAAANGLVYGMFRNSGQACGATTRLLVHESIHEPFVERVLAKVRTLHIGSPRDASTALGPVVSAAQEKVILGYLERARADGLHILCGGDKIDGPDHRHGYFIAPTIVDQVPPDAELAQHEVFGPVLSVLPFRDEDEAIGIANGTSYGLTAAIWTGDAARALRVSRRLRAGTIWHNDTYQQNVEGIWGGFKKSGTGRELGPHGIADMTEVKELYTDGTGLVMKPHYAQVLD
ncbi:aldehyde dehydrogenase family protein [Candidatus Binatia bacterium]|nr:aldehyde dehydrogenase family protein [Candidatus Binatia bacterium]